VHAVYASDTPTTGGVSLSAFGGAGLSAGAPVGLIAPVDVPARVTEHLLAGPGIEWQDQYFQSEAALGGGQSDVARSLAAGSVTTEDWNVYPLNTPLDSHGASAVPPSEGGSNVSLSATRVGRMLALDLTPFTDGTSGHTGTGYAQGIFGSIGSISGSYQIDDNGAKIASGKITPADSAGPFYDETQTAGRAIDGVARAPGAADRAPVPALDPGRRHVDVAVGVHAGGDRAVRLVLRGRLPGLRGPAAADLRLPGGAHRARRHDAARDAGSADQRRTPGAGGVPTSGHQGSRAVLDR